MGVFSTQACWTYVWFDKCRYAVVVLLCMIIRVDGKLLERVDGNQDVAHKSLMNTDAVVPM